MSLNTAWERRFKSFYDNKKYTENDRKTLIGIINQFDCNEIYNPNFTEREIFDHIYNKQGSHEGEITAKRQPNPFMIFRTTLGLTATYKVVRLGDGTTHSKIAGLMWGGIMPIEKKNFEELSEKFKKIHKEKFPNYEYKPRQRNPVAGTFVENMTKNNFESETNNQLMLQQPQIPQQIPQQIQQISKDITWDQPSFSPYGLDANFITGLQYPIQQEPLTYYQFSHLPFMAADSSLNEMTLSEMLVSLPAESYPTNQLNTLNKPDNFNLNYPSQATPSLNKPNNFGFDYSPQETPFIAENFSNQFSEYDINIGYYNFNR
jgi:hypothetical protein